MNKKQKDFQERTDQEYIKYLRSQFQADILNRFVVTPMMRKKLMYSWIACKLSFRDGMETIKQAIKERTTK